MSDIERTPSSVFFKPMVSCVDIVLTGVPREKRHLRECLTLAPYILPYLHDMDYRDTKGIVTSPDATTNPAKKGSIYEYS